MNNHSSTQTASRLLSVLAILSASGASGYLLLPNPLADVFFAGIVLLSVLFALIGGIGAWTNRTPLVWVAALLLTGLTIVGLLSIGLFFAPAAVFLLGAAVFSQLAGPRTGQREAIVSHPPTVHETMLKSLTGTVSVVVGAGMVYIGAFTQELFGACSSETLACALETTHWDAVGITILGLIAISFGGWLLWKQIYIARVFASAKMGRWK
ncbi:hypothetical protein [Haladaptatus salinisoli]|uniref:hypothetical protein n=1 Tax=Haladaptatus salinisoli TaxID=2884876 RepID=UPI001D0B468A|nr:hypothetical protein [Haladaptatus salinisoli]